jgi:hypothetical protein
MAAKNACSTLLAVLGRQKLEQGGLASRVGIGVGLDAGPHAIGGAPEADGYGWVERTSSNRVRAA